MILTKTQLFKMALKEAFIGDVPNKLMLKLKNMPEPEFIESMKNELNYNLEPIRKNQYIVT